MNITLSLDDKLVKEARKIALERDTTLTGMLRDYLQKVVAESANSARRKRQLEVLERGFSRYSHKIGHPTWKRADLYERS